MSEKTGAVIYVEGIVQGVGYRNFVEEWAEKLGLKGYCQNLVDGRVLVEVEGERSVIELLIQQLRQGPRRARVTEAEVTWKPYHDVFSGFSIRYS
jgi:acylphosphatase